MPDDEFTCDISGLNELDAKVAGIIDKLKRQQLRNAVAAGAFVFRDAIEDFAPERVADGHGGNALPPGALKADIHVVLENHRDDRGVTGHAGPGVNTGYVANWLENGHRIVTHKGKAVGTATPHPFLRPAADSAAQAALDAFTAQLAEDLDK